MDRSRQLQSCLPSPEEELLLEACLERDEQRARESIRSLLDRPGALKLSRASARLLSSLGWQVARLGLAHPLAPELKKAHRECWALNQRKLEQTADTIEALGRAGIPTLLIKGLPLAFAFYPDAGLRPMGDVDLLVPSTFAEKAIELLEQRGAVRQSLKPTQVPGWSAGAILRLQHAAHFAHPISGNLDLHWFSLEECCSENADDGFWSRRMAVRVNGRSFSTLCAEDHFLHVCVHGLRAERGESSFRWIADAVWILRKAGPEFRWALVVREARERLLSYTLGEALNVLAPYCRELIPINAAERFRAGVGTRWEKWAHRSNLSVTPRNKVAALWLRFVRATPNLTGWQRLKRFPDYLRGRWTMDSYSATLRHTLRRGLGWG